MRPVGLQTVASIRYSARMTSTPPLASRPTPPSHPSVEVPPDGGVDAVTVWYLATCHRCDSLLSQPFLIEDERDAWVAQHVTDTGHTVVIGMEGLEELPELHTTGVIRRDDNGEFRFLCPAGDCERWNGPYATAALAIVSWRSHKPAATR